MTKTEKLFEYKTPEEYYERFIKPNFTFEIDTRPYGEAEIISSKDYENGNLDLPKHYKTKIKDKISKKAVTVDDLLRERFKIYTLETPSNMRMDNLEWIFRQISRFDNKAETFTIERPRENPNVVTRFLKPNERTKYAPQLYIYVTLHWVGCGLCHSSG